MGVIKRHIWCPECGKMINTYVEEGQSLEGVKMTCKCGITIICISDNKIITKWKAVREECL